MKHRKPRSGIEIFIQGEHIIIYEHFSYGSAEQVLKKARTEYGIEFHTKGHNRWCG